MEKDKFDEMIEKIKSGKNLVIATYCKAWRITAKDISAWKKVGRSLLKNSTTQDGFYMARGKSFDYITPVGCKVYFEE